MTMGFLTRPTPSERHAPAVGRKMVIAFDDRGAAVECEAVIAYDPDINMFRGEFIGLNGGADFYAANAESLEPQAKESLRVFFQVCEEQGIDPFANRRGKSSAHGGREILLRAGNRPGYFPGTDGAD